MINDLQTSLTDISDEQLNQLFAEALPDGTDGKDGDSKDKGGDKQDNNDKNPLFHQKSINDIPIIDDIDDLLTGKEDGKEDGKEEGKDGKKDGKEEEDNKEDGKKEDKKEDGKEEKKDEIDSEAVSEILTNTVNFLVEKKIFKDFEGRADMKFTEELYAELLEKQIETLADERYGGKKKSAGEYGEAILDYLEKGGNPDQIIDLFKERKEVEDFDTTTDDDKKDLITKWYKEVHGWKNERIQKHLGLLQAEEGALEEEIDEIKNKYKEHYNNQLAELRKEQDELERATAERKKIFEQSISSVIDSNKEFDDKRKKFLKDSLFKFKKTSDGQVINDFYVKFNEWQSNPEKYVKLLEFIMDEEGLMKRRDLQIQKKNTEDTFKFIKGNGAVSKTRGGKHQESESSQYSGTKFSFI